MQFVSMEVNRHGSSDQLQLGKLSPGLNAICGPNGSGKTTLLNWLRQMAIDNAAGSTWTDRPNSLHAPQYGKVELRNQQNTYNLTQSSNGKITCSTGRGFDREAYLANAANTALSAEQKRVFNELTGSQHGVDNIQRLETLARTLGIDEPAVNHPLVERQSLLARQTDINTRLRSLEGLRATREGLLSRRGQLEAELHRAQRESQSHRGYGVLGDRERLEDHRSALATELRDVRAELAALERDIAGQKSGWPLRRRHHELDIGSTYREQLEQLDARLDRWRQTLRDLRAHRERLEHDATDARLDKQIGDQLSITKTAEPRAALRALEAQLLTASQQLDALIDRQDRTYESYHAQASLPESLRNMQRDLYEVCQQLARQESTTAAETLRQQAAQLARSEAELLQSVEKLIDERASLLHKIADEYHLSMDQLTLAFGDWCECHDHPHLTQWLLNEAPGAHSHQAYTEETHRGEQQRIALQSRIAELQSQLKEVEAQLSLRRQPEATKLLRSEADVARDLDKVIVELRDLEERDRLRVELDEIRRSLAKLPVETVASDRFRQLVNQHLDAMTAAPGSGGPEMRQANSYRTSKNNVHSHTAIYLNGSGSNSTLSNGRALIPAAPAPMIELAMRLAIAEAMFERGQPISLLVDGPLDHLAPELQQLAVRHLDSVGSNGQQIVLFSSDERIAELVRSAHGWVGYMHAMQAVRPVAKVYSVPKPAYDVNRQLLAYANDHEADKWYEPAVPRQRLVRSAPVATTNHRLTEVSLIEDCPSLEATSAARLRALGIDRVGDLLATDPHWLAEHLRLNGVTSSTVMRWQSEARLLCNVPQLRPFDARVLAGAGVRHPRQLAEMHPSQLLERVECFLATDRGRDILRSGNSYELSRITSWIASAKHGDARGRSYVATVTPPPQVTDRDYDEMPRGEVSYRQASETRPAHHYYGDPAASYEAADRHDHDGREPEAYSREYDDSDHDYTRSSRPLPAREVNYPVVHRAYEPRERQPRVNRELRDLQAIEREPRESVSREFAEREPRRSDLPSRTAAQRESRKTRQAVSGQAPATVSRATASGVKNGRQGATANGARFYLDLSSPVVDAPSIGPRVAEKLELMGIETVKQFIAANAEMMASRLDTKRVDASTVRDWQDQARLVCRIPNLRGHDAQLLVACKVTSPEELSRLNATSLLAQVTAVVKSSEGQRMLRGSPAPDLVEVTDWINWSTNSRSLNAA